MAERRAQGGRRLLTGGLLVALGFVAAVAPLATDLYLPSLPLIAHDLGATESATQLTLTAFMIGMALGQLVIGPLSDRHGRRPVLIAALAVFAVATAALIVVADIVSFTVIRVVEGLSGAAGIVLARAVIADLARGAAAVRAISLLAVLTGLAPLVAPIVGGTVSAAAGWRVAIAVLAAIAVAMVVVAVAVVRESLPESERQPSGMRATFGNFARLGRDAGFVGYAACVAAAYGAMLAYISSSPFIVETILGLGPVAHAVAFASGATALVTGNIVNSRVAPRIGARRMLATGGMLVALGVAGFAVVLLVPGWLGIVQFAACAFVITAGAGISMSNGTALALGRAEFARGAGSAFIGAAQFCLAALAVPLVGIAGDRTTVPTIVVVAILGCGSIAATLVARAAVARSEETDSSSASGSYTI